MPARHGRRTSASRDRSSGVRDRADRAVSHVFGRRGEGTTPIAARGEGAWIFDAEGNRYLDASGGAIVVGIGHGDRRVAAAAARQLERVAYVHGTAFTTE